MNTICVPQRQTFNITKFLYLFILSALLIFSPAAGLTDELMDKIEKKGVLRVGFQEDVTPFSSFDEISRLHRGFSVDMAGQLVHYLSKRFNKTIRLEPISLRATQRAAMILNDEIDIEMGASTQTYEREKEVDFSLIYFTSETTFLVSKASGILETSGMSNKRIVAGKGTTNLLLLKQMKKSGQILPKEILSYDTHNLALWALVNGEADAYCADRVLLATKRLQTPKPEDWIILEDSVGYEPYAFMIPENNSDFRDFVNDTIRWTILTGKYFDIYAQWMGPLGIGPFKMSPSFKEYLSVITYPIPDNWWAK